MGFSKLLSSTAKRASPSTTKRRGDRLIVAGLAGYPENNDGNTESDGALEQSYSHMDTHPLEQAAPAT